MVQGHQSWQVVLFVFSDGSFVCVSQVCGARVFLLRVSLCRGWLGTRLCGSAGCFDVVLPLLPPYESGIPDILVDCIVIREYIWRKLHTAVMVVRLLFRARRCCISIGVWCTPSQIGDT